MFCRLQKPPVDAQGAKGNKRGFALVLTLALLSVTFLLVLTLISYIIVELRMADNRKAYVLARAHAKLGLLVAVGELQKHAGPDQRVTATAAILDEDPYTPEVEGVEQPYWTGIWKRDPAIPHAPPGQDSSEPWNDPPSSEWDAHPEKELVWLVSGNEGKDIGDDDYLHPTSSSLADPDYSNESIWLVSHAVSQPEERVKAIKTSVNLSSPRRVSSASASEKTSGSYAYWVGDEGVKITVNLPQPDRLPDAKEDFLLNQARFEVSPGPNLDLVEMPNGSLDLSTVDSAKLEKVVNVSQLQFATGESDDSPDSLKDYFHHLTSDAYGVLSDVLLGGLKRDLTAGLGDGDQFASYLAGVPLFKDRIPFMKDFNPLDWSKDRYKNLKWVYGLINQMRWLRGPPWDYLKDYYMLFNDLKFDSSYPLESSLPPRVVQPENYPNRNGEFWTERYKRREPQTHPITPLLLEAKVGHTLEMVPAGGNRYRPRIAIYPSLALWNPYNVELEAAQYELLWQPDPTLWVYPTNKRETWAKRVMRFEKKNKIPPSRRLWDKDGDERLTNDLERNTMHEFFLGTSKKARKGITYGMGGGQGGGQSANLLEGKALRVTTREMHQDAFYLYRYASGHKEHESISGWTCPGPPCHPRGRGGTWHPILPRHRYIKPMRLRTNAVSLAPGEKLYFTLTETKRFNPAEEHFFNLRNHLSFDHYLYYNVPRQLCPLVPGDEPVTFVYTAGGIGGYWLDPFQRTQELDETNKNPKVLGTTLFMIKNGKRYPIKKINRGISSIDLTDQGSYQDYGRADIVSADPSRVIGPRINHKLSTHHQKPQLVFVEHNPRSFVDPWHLGPGDQWWRGQETDLEEGIGDHDFTDEAGVVFSVDPNPDESLSGDFYNGTGGRTYYGYQGHSFDVAGFHRVSRGNNGEQQFLPRTSRAVLFDVPRQPLMSLASLQHVNLSYFGNSPSYAIGNSYATSLVSRNRKWTRFNQINTVPLDFAGSKKRWGNEHQNTMIDYSYYANEKLWDGFFFSTVPTKDLEPRKYPPFENFDQYFVDARKPLPNPRMTYYAGLDRLPPEAKEGGSLRHFQKAASNLLVDGAFNVNSTSVEAWKAQLGSLSQSKLHVRDLQDGNELAANGRKSVTLDFGSDQFPFPRLGVSMGQSVNPESGNFDQDFWTGFAALNEEQLQRLAEEVVQEVKFRGPFLSMGDFVNRRLANPPGHQIVRKLHKSEWPSEDEESRQGLRGTLQAAIHDAGINDGGLREKYGYKNAGFDFLPDNIGQFNAFGYVAAGLNNDKTDKGNSQIPYNRKTNWGIGYDASIRQKKVRGVVQTTYRPRSLEFSHGEAPDNMLAATNGVTGAMMPGWLSQADVLTSLAPIANVRSDTFVVRTYGDIEPDYPGVKVWCEAIVQRVPEYIVDDVQDSYDGDTPHARPMEPYDDLNGNGERDTGEPFTDYDSNGKHSFIADYGAQKLQNPDNKRFGRRFRIVRFRWLTADEV